MGVGASSPCSTPAQVSKIHLLASVLAFLAGILPRPVFFPSALGAVPGLQRSRWYSQGFFAKTDPGPERLEQEMRGREWLEVHGQEAFLTRSKSIRQEGGSARPGSWVCVSPALPPNSQGTHVHCFTFLILFLGL